MKDAFKILEKAYSDCVRASLRPWDAADHGAVIIASAMFYLRHGYRFPALSKSTTEIA